MSEAIKGLKPELLWNYFAKICQIPHCSKNEAAILTFLAEEGQKYGAEIRHDKTGNICLAIPASKGFENSPVAILQAHVDMVCEKRAGVEFDFAKDPIVMKKDGEWITATDTTLGADNGIGVAAALAVMADKDIVHGPLELLFTVDEETGLTGAMGLDPSIIKGRILLNTDSEEDGMLYVGCAGGTALNTELPITWENIPDNFEGYKLKVSGLFGGHSGGEIHLNRGNAIKIVSRVFKRICNEAAQKGFAADIQLAGIQGGTAHNAIPRDAEALLAMNPEREVWLNMLLAKIEPAFKAEFTLDKDLAITLEKADKPGKVFGVFSTVQAISMLLGFHNGVYAMSREIKGLVETSNSLATATVKEGRLYVVNSTRYSQADSMEGLLLQNEAVSLLAGAISKRSDGYPGWQPNMDSAILKLQKQLFEKRYGKEPIITAIHAGLECGIIGEHFDDMDMVSFGPEIKNPHSPDEMIWIPTIERFWELLSDTLEAIAEGQYKS